MGKYKNPTQVAVQKKDFQLTNGQMISIGVNFYTIDLMSDYPNGGFLGLEEAMKNKDEDPGKAVKACGYLLYCLIRSSGMMISQEKCLMMIGFDDIEKLMEIFEEYVQAVNKVSKKKQK